MSNFTITIEQPLALAKTHQIALLCAAVEADRASESMRAELALHLFVQDRFDDAIALYLGLMDDAPEAHFAVMLAECHISRETPEDDRLAEVYARQAAALAREPWAHAEALAALGKALSRQGRTDEARAEFLRALDADPHEVNAYKRLATLDLAAGSYAESLETADRLLAAGVGHARLLVARSVALARLGRIAAARAEIGLDRYLRRERLATPAGWRDLSAFNASLRAELERHPDLRYDRYGTASTKTWRIDEPAFATSIAIPALQEAIRGAVATFVAELDPGESVWTRARPAAAVLHNWCVLTDAEGYEEWHVHQSGWLSGVYYIDVPPAVLAGEGSEGCIAFGMPEDLVGEDNARAFGQIVVRPEPGLLMLFPSHTHHRTFCARQRQPPHLPCLRHPPRVSDSARRCLGWGLGIESELPIPGAMAAPAEMTIALRVLLGSVPAWRERTAWGPYRIDDANRFEFAMPGIGQMTCLGRNTVHVAPATGANLHDVAAMLIATVLPALLWARGDIVLHGAGAIDPGARHGTIVSGPSGSGKSTWLARRIARGARAIADDSIRLHRDGETVIASGLPGGIWTGPEPGGRERIFVPVAPASQRSAMVAGRLVLIGQYGAGSRTLHNAAKLAALLQNRHRPRILQLLGTEASTIHRLADLASALRMVATRTQNER